MGVDERRGDEGTVEVDHRVDRVDVDAAAASSPPIQAIVPVASSTTMALAKGSIGV